MESQIITRIIPTRMGTSTSRSCYCTETEDHPHAYGDKHTQAFYPCSNTGSSPRVWGQASLVGGDPATIRIIPTRMGTSLRAIASSSFERDHPHAYGDKAVNGTLEEIKAGSSPRVWGQDSLSATAPILSRIIPTRMGTR